MQKNNRSADITLDAFALLFATGTISYYLLSPFTNSALGIGLFWMASFIACAVLISKKLGVNWWGSDAVVSSDYGKPTQVVSSRAALTLTFAGAFLAAGMYLFSAKLLPNREVFAWLVFGLAILFGLIAVRSQGQLRGLALRPASFAWYPWSIGGLLAVVASLTLRPQSDDTNYLNISTWIAQRGTLPIADTIYSEQVLPTQSLGSAWEPMWGILSRLLHISAPTLLYVIGVALLTLLSVLATDRTLRAFKVRYVNLALTAIAIFLILDGRNIFSFGVFHGPRIWQGKAFFVSALLPLVLAAGVSWIRDMSRANFVRLAVVVIAATGATTTSAMLLSVILGVLFLVAGLQTGVRRASTIVWLLLGPIYVGLSFRSGSSDESALAQISSDPIAAIAPRFQMVSNEWVSAATYLDWLAKPGWHAALFGLVAIWGWLGIESRTARRVVGLLTAAWGLLYLPPVLTAVIQVTHTESIVWRFWWLLPIPLLVGAAASGIASGLVTVVSGRRNLLVVGALASVLFALIALDARPVWNSKLGQENNQSARLMFPPGWKVFGGYYDVKLALDEIAEPGDLVAARSNIEKSLAATTVDVHTVLPKMNWLTGIAGDVPEAHLAERLQIRQFTSVQEDPLLPPLDLAQFPAVFDEVGVNILCLDLDRKADIDLARTWGFNTREREIRLGTGKGQWCARRAD